MSICLLDMHAKAFDDEYYKKLVVVYLKQQGKAQKKDFKKLLWDKLPDSLTDKQKEAKVINLLTALRKADVIARDSDNQRTANWVLFKKIIENIVLNNLMEA